MNNKILQSLFAYTLCLMAMVTMTYSQTATTKQVIGSFSIMDGGFEGQIPGTIRNISGFKDSIFAYWTVNTGPATIVNTGGRSGPQYANYTYPSGSGGKPLQSPTCDSGAIAASTLYCIQYYYRTIGATGTAAVMTSYVCMNGTVTAFTRTPTGVVLAGTSGGWQKHTDTLTINPATISPNVVRYGTAGVRAGGQMLIAIDVDDFVMYAVPAGATADVTPPDPSTSPIATPLAGGTQMQLDWTAPVAGVDSGGYMIVSGTSDPATTPNVNGIYAVGNNVAAGEQVVYLGTSPSFIDAGLSLSTLYYYRIYTVDKAFNYSSSVSVSATTLPVEMVGFTASMNGTSALLKWNTATEINNMGFEIERRSVDGNQSSYINWQKIGFVAGNGTSNSPKEYAFTDQNLAPGIHIYRIKQIDNDGTFKYSGNTQVDAGVASKKFELLGNYPNPFNPATEIRFSVPEDGFASLKVYNMLGQMVATLFEGTAKSGHYVSVTFNASDMASGVYFSRLEYNGRNIVQRMLLAK